MNKPKIFAKKIPWSFIGVIVALISVAFAIYSWVYGRQPNISFEITNEANVLDVHKPLKDLNISFQGEDIQEKNLNLRILTIRIENTGRENILQNHYDLHDIWGFQVMDGKIIEIRLMDTNSEYLKENLSPRLLKEDTVQFIKTIFEKGKFFTLEALILHTRDTLPTITPIGKIAGIDRVVAKKSWLEKEKPTFLQKLFAGNSLVQTIRLIVYLVAWIILLIIVGYSTRGIRGLGDKIKKASRRREIKRHFGEETLEEAGKEKSLFDVYVSEGPENIKNLQKFLEDEDAQYLAVLDYKSLEEFRKKGKEKRELEPLPKHQDYGFMNSVIYPLIKDSVMTIERDKKVRIAQEFKETYDELLILLETKKTK